MPVLVTGEAGYIGSHTVRALREAGDEVTILDLRPLPDPGALPGVPAVQGDIADTPPVERLLRDKRSRTSSTPRASSRSPSR